MAGNGSKVNKEIPNVMEYVSQLDTDAQNWSQNLVERFITSLSKLTVARKPSFLVAEQILSQLITPDLKEFDLSLIVNLYPEEPQFAFAIKALQLVSSKAKICKLKIKILESAGAINYIIPQMNVEMRAGIRGLESLRHLDVDRFYFTIDDLIKLCREISSLRDLIVKIAAQPIQIFGDPDLLESFKNSFGKLAVFRFSSLSEEDHSKEFEEELTCLCVRHLPNLQFVGNFSLFADMTRPCMEQKDQSKLQHLSLRLKRSEAQVVASFDKFPDVHTLSLKWDSDYNYCPVEGSKIKALLEFSRLNTLKLVNITSPPYFKQFLKIYGKQLKELDLCYKYEIEAMDLEFKLICEFCPELETIDLRGIRDITDSDWSMASFSELKELNLIFTRDTTHLIQLSDLLSAPNLREMTLVNIRVSEDELKKTLEMTEAGEISSKIDYLKFFVLAEENVDDSLENAMNNNWDKLVNVLKKTRPDANINIIW
ncbi:Hypothetical predicted protein [Cloeon dipterum]|uniref:Uncharacterized protein n=1 Tax=Cloeon dipterum TaxID=197152 RepID=A0A8S1DPC2_9INSE|nr:Hypothetical predicted protein [Cloeon dipterum]